MAVGAANTIQLILTYHDRKLKYSHHVFVFILWGTLILLLTQSIVAQSPPAEVMPLCGESPTVPTLSPGVTVTADNGNGEIPFGRFPGYCGYMGPNSRGNWYSFSPSAAQVGDRTTATASTCGGSGNIGSVISVFIGSGACSSLSCVSDSSSSQCADSIGAVTKFKVENVSSSSKYFIFVGSSYGEVGTYSLTLSISSAMCGASPTIPELTVGSIRDGDNFIGEDSFGFYERLCWFYGGIGIGKGRWYYFRPSPALDGTALTVSTCGGSTNFSTVVAVLRGSGSCSSLYCSGQTAGVCTWGTSVNFVVRANTIPILNYYIFVGGMSEGNYSVSLQLSSAKCGASPNISPLYLNGAITGDNLNGEMPHNTFLSTSYCSYIGEQSRGTWYYYDTRIDDVGTVLTVSTCGPETNFYSTVSIFRGDGACSTLSCLTGTIFECGLGTFAMFKVESATRYYIFVGGYRDAVGNYTVNITPSSAQCGASANTTKLEPNATVTGDNLDGEAPYLTFSTACTNIDPSSRGKWYDFAASEGEMGRVVRVTVCGNFPSIIAVFKGSGKCSSLNCVAESSTADAAECGPESAYRSVVEFPVSLSEPYRYFIFVGGYDGWTTGSYNVSLFIANLSSPAASCGLSPEIDGIYPNSFVSDNNSGLSAVYNHPIPSCGVLSPRSRGRWYQFKVFPSFVGNNVTLSTCNFPSEDTIIVVFKGSAACSTLACVTSADDTCSRGASVSFQIADISPLNYFIFIGGYHEQYVYYNLSVTMTKPPPTTCQPTRAFSIANATCAVFGATQVISWNSRKQTCAVNSSILMDNEYLAVYGYHKTLPASSAKYLYKVVVYYKTCEPFGLEIKGGNLPTPPPGLSPLSPTLQDSTYHFPLIKTTISVHRHPWGPNTAVSLVIKTPLPYNDGLCGGCTPNEEIDIGSWFSDSKCRYAQGVDPFLGQTCLFVDSLALEPTLKSSLLDGFNWIISTLQLRFMLPPAASVSYPGSGTGIGLGAILGISIGSGAGIIILVTVIALTCRRRRIAAKTSSSQKGPHNREVEMTSTETQEGEAIHLFTDEIRGRLDRDAPMQKRDNNSVPLSSPSKNDKAPNDLPSNEISSRSGKEDGTGIINLRKRD